MSEEEVNQLLAGPANAIREYIGAGLDSFQRERVRQLVEEDHPIIGDIGRGKELLAAGICYLGEAFDRLEGEDNIDEPPAEVWPWEIEDWKPTQDARRMIEKGGALIAAAYDAFENGGWDDE